MKKQFICLLAIFSALMASAQSNPTGTVIYSLPQTVLSITVQSEREAFTAGPYASYAQKYLGVAARQEKPQVRTYQDEGHPRPEVNDVQVVKARAAPEKDANNNSCSFSC